MIGNIKVSVILPVYNAGEYLYSTLEMLCRSDLKEIEIIAVNDGSTDNSLAVLKSYAEKDNRVIVIDKENGGVFDARNRGLQEANGEYICFCDQDDLVETRMYEKMYKKIKESESEMAVCSVGWISNGKKVQVVDWICEDMTVEGKVVQDEIFLSSVMGGNIGKAITNKSVVRGNIWNCMILRQFIIDNNIKFRRYVNFEDDYLFVLDVLARINRITFLSDVLYFWTVNVKSESHAFRYIEDFYRKDIELQNAKIEIMQVAGCSKENIDILKKCNSVGRYARLVENEVNNPSRHRKCKYSVIKIIYTESEFKENIQAARYLSRGLIEWRIICRFLRIKCVAWAYGFAKIWSILRQICQDKSFWIGMQRKMAEIEN